MFKPPKRIWIIPMYRPTQLEYFNNVYKSNNSDEINEFQSFAICWFKVGQYRKQLVNHNCVTTITIEVTEKLPVKNNLQDA